MRLLQRHAVLVHRQPIDFLAGVKGDAVGDVFIVVRKSRQFRVDLQNCLVNRLELFFGVRCLLF